MGKFTGVLLASDFDNTIVDTASSFRGGAEMPVPSPRNCAALRYFMDNGGYFAVATGRALSSFIRLAAGVPMNAPAVLCNGAALYDFSAEAYLETNFLPDGTGALVQPVLDLYPDVAVEAYHIGNTIHAVQPNTVTRRHEHISHVAVTEAPTLLEVPEPLGKLMFEGDHGQLMEVRAYLEAQPWIGGYEMIFSDPQLLELTALGANKGGMVARLAQRLGVAPAHVYCAGDEANDLSMLTMAAEGFAPANCADAVRACGVTIVSEASRDALAEIVEILDRRYD